MSHSGIVSEQGSTTSDPVSQRRRLCGGPGKVGEAVRLSTRAQYAMFLINRCFESPNSWFRWSYLQRHVDYEGFSCKSQNPQTQNWLNSNGMQELTNKNARNKGDVRSPPPGCPAILSCGFIWVGDTMGSLVLNFMQKATCAREARPSFGLFLRVKNIL